MVQAELYLDRRFTPLGARGHHHVNISNSAVALADPHRQLDRPYGTRWLVRLGRGSQGAAYKEYATADASSHTMPFDHAHHGNGSPFNSRSQREWIARTTSADSDVLAAAKLSRACSTLFAPGITVETSGWARMYWSAACWSEIPGGNNAATCSTSAARRSMIAGDQRSRMSVNLLSRRYLPDSQPESSGTFTISPMPATAACRNNANGS